MDDAAGSNAVLSAGATVKDLEAAIQQLPQFQFDTWHHLMNGMYSRTIFIPEGCVLTGAEHRTDHINICFGDISVSTDEGMKRISGYQIIPTKAGIKRAGYAHRDTWWTTICRTAFDDLNALDQIESELVNDADKLQRRVALSTSEKPKGLEG